MTKQLNCIMLVDDNKIDNFFHTRVIKKVNAAKNVIAKESAMEALEYLKTKGTNGGEHPDIIFLDINMPGMNGWEFIEEYEKLDIGLQSKMLVIMLTTSENPDDVQTAKGRELIADFKSKPLTKDMLEEIVDRYYNNKVLVLNP